MDILWNKESVWAKSFINFETAANLVAGGFNPTAHTPPGMRLRTGRFTKVTGP